MKWIKMRVDLLTHPKVMQMAASLNAQPHRVIGGLLHVWSIFDAHTEDGILASYNARILDKAINWKNFSKAMIAVGWLIEEEFNYLIANDFHVHNSMSAKRRALDSRRKYQPLKPKHNGKDFRKDSAPDVEIIRNREEKNREQDTNSLSLIATSEREGDHFNSSADGEFDKFWDAYPRKEGRQQAFDAWKKAKKPATHMILAALEAHKQTEQWIRDEGRFILMPYKWISEKRWEDIITQSSKPSKYRSAW